MRALVLALNPAIDVEWRLDHLQWEEKNTIQCETRWAGGKGVNVARWLQFLGGRPRLLLPLGGEAGGEMKRYLRQEKLQVKIIPQREATRANVIVTTAAGRQLRLNQTGPTLSRREWSEALQATRKLLREASVLILSGSLPAGCRPDAYARLIRCAHQAGVKALLDCDGAALTAGVKARPFLVKPNGHELGQWWGKRVQSERDILRAANAMSEATRGWVLVSLGSRGGLLLNHAERNSFRARPPKLKPVNSVGAGDALLAAVARQIDKGTPPREWLRWGLAVGAAATQSVGGILPRFALVERLLEQVRFSEG